MKGLYFDRKLQYRDDLIFPSLTPEHSLIKISVAGICNTDREILKGYKKNFRGILGHEFVGIVEQSDKPELIGKRVVGELNEGCGKCYYCQNNLPNHCQNRKIIGMSIDGCFAEYMTIQTKLLHIVPDSIATTDAMFTEPLAAAFSIPNLIHIKPSHEIAIIGDGRLAYLIAQVVVLTGAKLTVIGKHRFKLKNFQSFAAVTINTDADFDIVIDATGSPEGVKQALKLVRSRGHIVVKSTYAERANFDFSEVVVREINIHGSRCGPFEPALQAIERKLIQLPVPELYKLENYQDAFTSKAFKSGFIFE